jgi:hypothetical protein
MRYHATHIHLNMFSVERIAKEIERSEHEFRFYRATGTPAQIKAAESVLGSYYRLLMREVSRNNLESIFETEDEYQVTIKKSKRTEH